jgi:nucleoside-diphosphate-sugar epimerase
MQQRIAIIGANGFVGRHLVTQAATAGFGVTGIVRSPEASPVVRERGGDPVLVPRLDTDAIPALVTALRGSAGLVYTASVATGQGVADRTDPAGLVNVIAACREAGVPRFVFFSGLGLAHYGMNVYCTNPYFLAKMAGEVALFRSSLAVTVFRPSYVFGRGEKFLTPLVARIATPTSTEIEIPGDGGYRLQPVSVADAARAAMGALSREGSEPLVVDLVGPEEVSYRDLIGRVSRSLSRSITVRSRPVEEALAEARSGGYFGLRPHDLACLLCDEVSDPRAVEALVGRPLESLDAMIAAATRAASAPGA